MRIAHTLKELEHFLEKWRLMPAQRYADGGVAIQVDRQYVVSLRPRSAAQAARCGWFIEARLARLSRDAIHRARQVSESATYGLGLIAFSKATVTIDRQGAGLWLRQFIAAPVDCEQIESAFESFCDALFLWSSHQSHGAPLLQGVVRPLWA